MAPWGRRRTRRPGTLLSDRAKKHRAIVHVRLQVFFQRYFAQKHVKEHARAAKVDKRKSKRVDDSDAGSDDEDNRASVGENSDAEEDEIWKVSILQSCQRGSD